MTIEITGMDKQEDKWTGRQANRWTGEQADWTVRLDRQTGQAD